MMPTKRSYRFIDVEKDSLLLVEGYDDALFFETFLTEGLNNHGVQVAEVGSDDKFRPFLLGTLVNAPSFRRLRRMGIIRDADTVAPTARGNETGASAAFQSLQGSLADAGLPVPDEVWQTASSSRLDVSIAILPDGYSDGNLEELCLTSLDPNLLLCVDNYINCLQDDDQPPIAQNRLSKARVYTYLAAGPTPKFIKGNGGSSSRRKPGLRLGTSAQARVWNWNSCAFSQVADFLRKL